MSKPLKTKKEKVPKITEAQYTEYISQLRETCEPKMETKESAVAAPSAAVEE